MLNFIANKLIRKPYEVAYYGTEGFNEKLNSVSQAKMENPLTPMYSPFPIAMDIVRSIQNRKKYSAKVAKKIQNLLLVYKLVTQTKMHLYTLFMTTPNSYADNDYRVSDPRNHGCNPFTSYHTSMQSIRKDWNRSAPYLHDLISSIECTFGYRVSFNVHLHGLLGSTRPLTESDRRHLEARASHSASRQMNNEPVTVHIKPFRDEAGSRLRSVTAFVHYMLKQYHLPVCKSMADYHRFMARPARERHMLVTSLLHSTAGLRCLTHVIGIHSAFIQSLLRIHKTVQPSLFTSSTTTPQSAPDVAHHYTSSEQWARATRKQMKTNAQTVANGVERLHEATSADTYKINQGTKKDAIMDVCYIHIQIPTATIDRMRASGIPP